MIWISNIVACLYVRNICLENRGLGLRPYKVRATNSDISCSKFDSYFCMSVLKFLYKGFPLMIYQLH